MYRRTIKSALTKLVASSAKTALPFNVPVQITRLPQKNLEFDYTTDISAEVFKKHENDMKKYWGPYSLTPQGISDDILTCIERNKIIDKYFVEFNGNICFRIKDEFIYSMLIARLIKSNAAKEGLGGFQDFLKAIGNELKTLEGAQSNENEPNAKANKDQEQNDSKKVKGEEASLEDEEMGVLFPFGEVFQKMYLNSLRGFNICESFARMQEYLGAKKVRRFGCLQNFGYFHGVLLNYLASNYDSKSAPITSLNVEHVVEFLRSKGLNTEKQIKNAGREGLELAHKDEGRALWDKINESAIKDLMSSLTRFCGLGQKDIEIYESSSVAKNAKHVFKNLQQRGVLEFYQNKGYCVKLKSKIVIMDEFGFLTKEGLFLAFCNEISEKYPNIRELLVSTDIQDDLFYQNIQEIIDSFGWKIFPSIKFAGHNDLLTSEKNLFYLEDYLRSISTELGNKLRKIYPTLPEHLTPEQEASILSLLLGWVRFWDHTKGRRNSYVLNSEEVIDFIIKKDQLVNLRLKLKDLSESLQNAGSLGGASANLQIPQEKRILGLQLLQFDEVVEESLGEKNIDHLVQYLNMISGIVSEMIKRDLFLNRKSNGSSQSSLLDAVLVEVSFEVISNCFYILGVLNTRA